MSVDVKAFCGTYERCQKVNRSTLKAKSELKPIPPPRGILRQIGVDLIQLPEVDGFKYVVIAVDYLSKYSMAKPLKDKTAVSIADFFMDWICLFGCPQVQINDQGRELCNEVSDELHRRTGVKQRLTSAYHPQSNGLVGNLNGTVKNGLLKVLEGRIKEWPTALQGIMFAHRTNKHFTTGYSPFFMLFGQEPVLPIDLTGNSNPFSEIPESPPMGEYNVEAVAAVADSFLEMKADVVMKSRQNIKEQQKRQKHYYDLRHGQNTKFSVGQKVMMKNMRREDRKGGWSQDPKHGPYIVTEVGQNNTYKIKNLKTKVELRTWKNATILSPYRDRQEEHRLCLVPKQNENESNGSGMGKGEWKEDGNVMETEEENGREMETGEDGSAMAAKEKNGDEMGTEEENGSAVEAKEENGVKMETGEDNNYGNAIEAE